MYTLTVWEPISVCSTSGNYLYTFCDFCDCIWPLISKEGDTSTSFNHFVFLLMGVFHRILGTLFIDISAIYCFGKGLAILMCKDIYQYLHFMYTYTITLQIFEINSNS